MYCLMINERKVKLKEIHFLQNLKRRVFISTRNPEAKIRLEFSLKGAVSAPRGLLREN